MTDDVRGLLGGYATGTLTEAEQKRLFEAALQDQDLFAALADEEALRDLLADPAAKARLLRTVTPSKPQRVWSVPVAIAAMLVITVGVGMLWLRLHPPAQEVAMRLPAPAVSEPARPEAERAKPKEFKPAEPVPQKLRTPAIAPPPSAIVVATKPRLQVIQPPPAAAPPAPAQAQMSELRVAEAEAKKATAERIAHRLVTDDRGTRAYLTPHEPGTLRVVARANNRSTVVLTAQASPGIEVATSAIPDDATELVATLEPGTRTLSRLAPAGPRSAARESVSADAAATGSAAPYVLRIPLPKK